MNPERLKYLARLGDNNALKKLVSLHSRYNPARSKRTLLPTTHHMIPILQNNYFNTLDSGEGSGLWLSYGYRGGSGTGDGHTISMKHVVCQLGNGEWVTQSEGDWIGEGYMSLKISMQADYYPCPPVFKI